VDDRPGVAVDRVFPTPGAVDDLVGHDDGAGPDLASQRTDGTGCEDLTDTDRTQRPEVCPVVHPVWREPMLPTVPRDERHPAPMDLADHEVVTRRTERRGDAQPLRVRQELIEARATDDADVGAGPGCRRESGHSPRLCGPAGARYAVPTPCGRRSPEQGGGDNPLHDQDAAAVGLPLEPLEPLAWLEPDRPDDEPDPEPDLRGEDAARAFSDEPERSDPDFPNPELSEPDPPDLDPDLPGPDPPDPDPDPDPDLPDPDPPDPDPDPPDPDPPDPGFSDPDLSAPVFSDPDLSGPELSDSDFSDEPAPSDEPEPFTATRESLR